MRKISSRRIGQVWLHHTGHDTSKGFGTKTREWEMDTVVSLTEAESAVSMEFKKKRLWTPKTADQFKPLTIVRGENGWTSIGEASATKKSARSERCSTPMTALPTVSRRQPASMARLFARSPLRSYATSSSRAACWKLRTAEA
jgi:hypothetical protein